MKKTTDARVAKTLFTFDQDALEHLENYLNSLEEHFKGNEDAPEILEDIEASLAEKLSKSNTETIDLKVVKECIQKIGTLEELVSSSDKVEKTEQRKFARDPEARWIGGVASGFARYFELEVIWVRIIFALLAFFIPISSVVYALFWIFMAEEGGRLTRKEQEGLEKQRWYLSLSIVILLILSSVISLIVSLFFGALMGSMGAFAPVILASRLPETLFLIYLAVKLLKNHEPSKSSVIVYLVASILSSLVATILIGGMIVSI